ncbi:putative F-box protein PP2-B12 [Cannabis sativa]|uniref:putative F-box protein PP2-B12 n=1 Tax=Cannabis sativa TaxID=3483 RepID=UPI0029C9E8F7|nr:putative F-box protein PP2-B12 [Cannabis sativa]
MDIIVRQEEEPTKRHILDGRLTSSSLDSLPEGCVCLILSLTTPRDATRSSAVSTCLNSAAQSDVVWEHFLPTDYTDIISRSTSPLIFSSKKDLYLRLSLSPVLLDEGNKSIVLNRLTGNKSCMIGSRKLAIAWAGSRRFWNWLPLSNSRFGEVIHLRNVCWLDICGKIEKKMLSPNTNYAAYLVYNIAFGFQGLEFVRVSMRFLGPGGVLVEEKPEFDVNLGSMEDDERGRLKQGDDGWLELKVGEFFNGEEEDNGGFVETCLKETRVLNWKSGLVVQGIDFRPNLPLPLPQTPPQLSLSII